ncbi:hypothetical protein [Roseivirga sp.]|uniref:hypothetical protein n=1 Tax=Roseivirga sp. TaxID=1964215 RepID=UPI003B51C1E7
MNNIYLPREYSKMVLALKDLFYFKSPLKDAVIELDKLEDKGSYRNTILDYSDCGTQWKTLLNELRATYPNLKVSNTTNAQQPSWNGELFIELNEFGYLAGALSIRFSISRLGPYFTVLGIDGVKLNRAQNMPSENDKRKYNGFMPYTVHASPSALFEPYYEDLRKAIKAHFPDSRQIPCEVLFERIPGLRTDELDQDRTIYEALFLGEIKTFFSIKGNRYYPQSDWLVD